MSRFWLLGVTCAIAAPVAVAQAPPRTVRAPNVQPTPSLPIVDTLWMVGLDETAGADSLFGIMASSVAQPALNRIFVTDPQATTLRIFDPTSGQLLYRVGRRGGGPGEFKFADRTAVRKDGTTFVYDRGRGVVIAFDSALQWVQDVHPELPVSEESFLVSDKYFVFSGIIRQSLYNKRAIHVFARKDGRHIRSFGQLPDAPSDVVSQTIGAGVLAWARDGNIWWTQRAPYLIEKFTPEGELLLQVERENDFLPAAGDRYKVEFQGRRMRIESRPHAVSVSILETESGMLLHEIWLYANRRVLDVFDQDLQLRASYVGEMPVFVASLGDGRFLVNGRGPDDQFWVGVVRMELP